MKRNNWLLILAVVTLVAVPLFIVHKKAGGDEIFAGADDRATDAIKVISPGYKPWFSPVFEPPSGEIETMLFSLQAALGAALIGYYFGLAKGRAEKKIPSEDTSCPAARDCRPPKGQSDPVIESMEGAKPLAPRDLSPESEKGRILGGPCT